MENEQQEKKAKLEIIKYKEIDKGSLKASFVAYLPAMQLFISCTQFESNGKRWISLPTRQYEKEGVKAYQWLTWFSKEKHIEFENACFALIDDGNVEREQGKPSVNDDCPF